MKKLITILLLIIYNVLSAQNTTWVKGRITDKINGQALAGATIGIKEIGISTIADQDGNFQFINIDQTNLTFTFTYIGYKTFELSKRIEKDKTTIINVALTISSGIGNEVVVTASMRPEKIVNAPASIHVIGQKELSQFAGSNSFELFSKVQGIEFVRTGIDYVSINARGFNRLPNNKVFQMTDGRSSMATVSTGLPSYNTAPGNKEDIEKIEIMLGPQAALYGPNVNRALFYTTTKDPRIYQGTTVAVSAGNHYQFSARFRHAQKINQKWAYKLTGEYVAGEEFKFFDSVYAGSRTGFPYGPEVGIPERNVNFDFRHTRGEAYLYYSMTPKRSDIIISGGTSENQLLGATGGGRNQLQGLRVGFLQARFTSPHLYASIYNTWGNTGNSYNETSYTREFWNRTHSLITNPADSRRRLPADTAEIVAMELAGFKEKNQRLNADLQYNYSFRDAGLILIAGASYQKEKPNSFGTTLADAERRIYVTQAGAVVQLEKSLPWDLRFIGAARIDHHSTQGNFFSPKLAIIKNMNEHNFRITWAKAYAVPSILYQYGASGTTFGNGSGVTYIPNGRNVNDPASVRKTTPLKPEEISSWEIGYKGNVVKKLYVDVNAYFGITTNFIGPAKPVGGRALELDGIKIYPANPGEVDSIGILKGASFSTYFNYAKVNAYGVDLGLNYVLNKLINIGVNYSWFNSNITKDNLKNDANGDSCVTLDERSMNAPKHRAVATISIQNLFKHKLFFNVSGRYTEQYDFYTGSQIGTEAGKGKRGIVYRCNMLPQTKNFDWGPLGGYVVLDANAGYQLNEMINLNLGVTNILDSKQLESVGSPFIGRLVMLEVRVHIPRSIQ